MQSIKAKETMEIASIFIEFFGVFDNGGLARVIKKKEQFKIEHVSMKLKSEYFKRKLINKLEAI